MTRMVGNESDDHFHGTDEDDVMQGKDGNDVLEGTSGSDTLLGGKGEDFIAGGDGNNYLDGGRGDDTLSLITWGGCGGLMPDPIVLLPDGTLKLLGTKKANSVSLAEDNLYVNSMKFYGQI